MKLVKFGAPWCAPCRKQDKILDELLAEGYDVEKVNIDESRERAEINDVLSVPTIIIFDDEGKEVDRYIGLTQKDILIEALS